ncbi:helix-turn-helix domain-containing protein, partial [Streptomyces antimycoticus]|nr:helix-turn-helix domain-containing protein [Streptomyces sp. DSM 41602]
MAEPVRVRRLTDQEGQRLQQIVRRGSTSSVRYRRAMMLLASADGNRVPVIAQLVQADEDTVRDVIHRFNEIGLACLDPNSLIAALVGFRSRSGCSTAGPSRLPGPGPMRPSLRVA